MTQFVKGPDSRRNIKGAPRGTRKKKEPLSLKEIEEGKLILCPLAIKTLKALMREKETPASVKLATAKFVLEGPYKLSEVQETGDVGKQQRGTSKDKVTPMFQTTAVKINR